MVSRPGARRSSLVPSKQTLREAASWPAVVLPPWLPDEKRTLPRTSGGGNRKLCSCVRIGCGVVQPRPTSFLRDRLKPACGVLLTNRDDPARDHCVCASGGSERGSTAKSGLHRADALRRRRRGTTQRRSMPPNQVLDGWVLQHAGRYHWAVLTRLRSEPRSMLHRAIRSASTTVAGRTHCAPRWRRPSSGRPARPVAFLASPRCRADSAAASRNAA